MSLASLLPALALVLLAALAAAPRWSHWAAGRGGRWAFATALVFAFLAGRWPSLTDNRPWPNPDEAQMIAGAMTLRQHPVFWRDVDGTTHGPLDQWPLTVASWLGLPLDFRGARILAVGCMVTMVLLLQHTLAAQGETVSRLAVLPAVAWLSASLQSEFHQLSSEHVPILLLASACATEFSATSGAPGFARSALFGALVVATPFAKLQAAPLAAVLGCYWLWCLRANARSLQGVMAGGILVLALVLGPVLLAGAGGEFWSSYLVANRNYALAGGWNPPLPRFIWGLSWLLFITAALLAVAANVDFRRLAGQSLFRLGVLLAAAAIFVILLPGTPILHYWLLGIPALVLLAGAALGNLTVRPWFQQGIALVAILLVLPFALKRSAQPFPSWDEVLAHPGPTHPAAIAAITGLAGADERIAIWGWAPEVYVLSRRSQATREAHTFAQIQPGPLQAHYQARFLADLQRSQPPVFVDAVNPAAFTFNDRARQGHESFPALGQWIAAHYEFVSDLDGLRIYRRRTEPR